MKKALYIVLVMFLIASCGHEKEETGIFEEASEITEGYVETLEETPEEAREVKELLDKRNEELLKNLDSIK